MRRPFWTTDVALLFLSVILLVYGNLTALAELPPGAYISLNVAVATAVSLGMWASGLSMDDLGLSRRSIRQGLRWAGPIAVLIAAGVGLGLLALGHRFPAGTIEGAGAGGVLGQIFIRIPFGTAMPEEILFRGVLFGAWARARSISTAVLASSVT